MVLPKKSNTTQNAEKIAQAQQAAQEYTQAANEAEQKLNAAAQQVQQAQANDNKPVFKTRAGLVTAAIFENKGVNKSTGVEFITHSVVLQRGYRDANGVWQNTNSLRRDDIPRAILVLQKCYETLALSEDAQA